MSFYRFCYARVHFQSLFMTEIGFFVIIFCPFYDLIQSSLFICFSLLIFFFFFFFFFFFLRVMKPVGGAKIP